MKRCGLDYMTESETPDEWGRGFKDGWNACVAIVKGEVSGIEPPSDCVVRDVAAALRHVAADLRAAGDVQLVRLDENGVAPEACTLADELWLYALRLDAGDDDAP